MNDQIGRPTRYDLWMWLAIPVLLWSPIHVGVSRGNVSVVYTALVVLALGPAGRSWIKSSAIGVTTAGMVKPQLGLPFTLAWLFLERGRTWGVVMVTAAIAGVIPLLMTQLMQPTWTDDYIRIITRFTVDGTGNPKPDYWWSYTMIDLLPVLHLWIDSRWVAKLAAALIVGLAGLAWLGAWRRAGRSRVAEDWAWRLAAVSAVSIMMLLVTYHRTYDATFMLLPLAWSCWRLTVRETSRSSRRLAMIVAMTSGTFVLPCSAILARAIDQGHLQRAWFEIPLIRAMTLHHQTILLVLILVLLLIDMWRSPLPSVTLIREAAAKSPGTEAAA